MVTVDRPPANSFVQHARKLYNPLGFSKGYNALLWFIFDGAMFGFILARLQYLNIWGVFCGPGGTATSECYWHENFDQDRIGIILHLGTILPAGLLVVFQFVPFVRYKAILYHRIAGYIVLLLALVSDAGAIMIAKHTFGGDYATQMFIGWLVIVTTISLALALINIKRLQIDQHRAWMLRAWFYFASIITLRIIQTIALSIEGSWPESQNYGAKSCAELLWDYQNSTSRLYGDFPACNPDNAQFATDGWVAVQGNFNGNVGSIMQALALNFGMAGVLAFFLHAAGIEIYLKLTPRENERLRQVSYEKQLERGFANPGSAGLVLEKFGDAEPWVPKEIRERPKPEPHASDIS